MSHRPKLTQGSITIIAGVVILVLNAIAKIPVLGIITGLAILLVGYAMIAAKNKAGGDVAPGVVLMIAGLLAALAALRLPLLGGLSSFVLVFLGLILIGYGLGKMIGDLRAR